MPGKPSDEEYATISDEAEDLDARGQNEEAMRVLQTGLERAFVANDEPFMHFFGSELARMRGDNEKALDLAQLGYRMRSDGHLFARAVAAALVSMKHYQEALEWCDRALATRSRDYPTLYLRGLALMGLEQFQDALDWFGRALAQRPGSYSALIECGIAAARTGHVSKALEWFDSALELQPEGHRALIERGVLLAETGKRQEALDWYNKALAVRPDDERALRMRGMALTGLGRHKEALECYERAQIVRPDNHRTVLDRGVVLGALGRYAEALECCEQVLEARPTDYRALCERGVILSKLRRHEEAIEWLDKALEVRPDSYRPLLKRGGALLELARYQEALASFDRALALRPNRYRVLLSRGSALAGLGRFEEALKSFDRALLLRPRAYRGLILRALALVDMGYHEEALDWLDRAIAVRPDSYIGHLNRGIVLSKVKRYDEAIAAFEGALEVRPDGYRAMSGRGVALAAQGLNTEAVQWFDKALAIARDDAEILMQRAVAAGLIGDSHDAIETVRAHLKQNPDDYKARAWLIRLAPPEDAPQLIEELARWLERRESDTATAARDGLRQKRKMETYRAMIARSAKRIDQHLFEARKAVRLLKKARRGNAKETFGALDAHLDRIRQTVHEFRGYCLKERATLKPANIGILIADLIERYRAAAHGIDLSPFVVDRLPDCPIDAAQLDPALGELIDNAIQFTPEGGRVQVSAEMLDTPASPRLRITIDDTGPGVPQAEKERIFKPLVSSRPGHTGLGLAVVRRFVENHGGTVAETGQPGAGARFEVELPAWPREEP